MANYVPKFEDTKPVDDDYVPKFEDTVEAAPPRFEDTVAADDEPGKLESFARGAVQGATFGFGDEIVGGIEGALTSKTYEQARDESRQANKAAEKANPWSYGTGNVGGGIAVSLVPYFGVVAKSAKGAAGVGAAYGGLSGLGASDGKNAGDVAMDTAIGAAFGGAGGLAMHGIIKGVGRLIGKSSAPDTVKSLAYEEAIEDALNGRPGVEAAANATIKSTDFEMGQAIQSRADKLFDALPEEDLVLPADLPNDFINRQLGRAPGKKLKAEHVEEFKNIWAQYNDDVKQKIWTGFKEGQTKLQAATQVRKEAITSMSKLVDPFEDVDNFWTNNMTGGQLSRKTDDAMGSNFYGEVYMGFTTGERRVAAEATDYLNPLKPLKEKVDELFPNHEALFHITNGTKIGKELEAGLSPEQLDVVNSFRNFYGAAVPRFNAKGMNIVPREDFTPHMRKDLNVARRELMTMADDLMSRYGNDININTVTHKLPKDVQDYLAAVNHLNEDTVDFVTLKHTKKFLETFKPGQSTKAATRIDGSAAFRREGEIPWLLLEKDPIKLATSYVISNLKSIHYREPLSKLHDNIAMLRAAGADKTADVWQKYAEQMTGRSGGHKARVEAMAEKLRDTGRKIADEFGWKKTGSTIEHLPETLSWMTAQIYPNYLGWRLDAPIRNLSQPLMVTAPEIGWKNATRVGQGAWQRALKSRAHLKENGLSIGSFLANKGMSIPKYRGVDAMDAIERGAQLANAGKILKTLDAGGKAGLFAYSMTDDINRFFTYHVAEEVADDILKNGTGRYTAMLKRMPNGFRTKLLQSVEKGNTKEFRRGLAEYLIEHTQFNYTRADLTMFGREYGRLVSMFTKWPLTVAGNIQNVAANEKGLKAKAKALGATYLAPLATLTLLDYGLDQMELSDSPAKKFIIGKNLAQNSPLLAIKDLAVPPIAQSGLAGVEGLIDLATGELEAAAGKFKKATIPFVPGGYIPVTYDRMNKTFGDGDDD